VDVLWHLPCSRNPIATSFVQSNHSILFGKLRAWLCATSRTPTSRDFGWLNGLHREAQGAS